jgi:asparagine synthetase B (glutamine-hydrolysing)
MSRAIPEGQPIALGLDSPSVKALEQMLQRSLRLRIQNIPDPPQWSPDDEVKIAVLFSGGLDCTVLARLAHDILPISEPIDLLNVAFENPRVAAAAAAKSPAAFTPPYEECPDRITGRQSHAELQQICPGRHWRFIAIDIPYMQTLEHRDEIKRLMRPHNTEMDLSIACALYFASRGEGRVPNSQTLALTTSYSTSARVLLSGLGADELFAGYTRHAIAFSRRGFQGLIDEIDLDVSRLGKRNLGRDDRVISHWGREARYPYLDEEFLAWALARPVWQKCGFGRPASSSNDAGNRDGEEVAERTNTQPEQALEPGKEVLRLLAWKLGLRKVAHEKKRAIQFGSRTAKMEKGRIKGTEVLS